MPAVRHAKNLVFVVLCSQRRNRVAASGATERPGGQNVPMVPAVASERDRWYQLWHPNATGPISREAEDALHAGCPPSLASDAAAEDVVARIPATRLYFLRPCRVPVAPSPD